MLSYIALAILVVLIVTALRFRQVLRLLQTVGQASGNTVVVGLGGQPQTIPLRQTLDEAGTEELPRAEGTED